MRTLNNFETNQKTQIKICTEVDRSVDPISVDSVDTSSLAFFSI